MGIAGPCDCISYNLDAPGTRGAPEAVLRKAAWFPDEDRETVCVDACFRELIVALWSAGIRTRGCCCGHNRDFPDIAIAQPADAERAAAIIRQYATQPVKLFIWVNPE